MRRVGGQVHVMTADGRIHTLDNPTAANVWGVLEAAGERGADAREVAASLVARFDVAPSRAVADAAAFLHALAGAGLLVPGALAADPGGTTGSRD